MQLALTEQITLACLRQQAERLNISSFATMQKLDLIKAILKAQLPIQIMPEKRAGCNSLLVSLGSLSLGKLQQWLKDNPEANPKEVKQVEKRIRLVKEEESE